MAQHQPFVIPAGVSLEIGDRGVSVFHVGDIVLQSSLGDRMDRVVSQEGSVTLRGSFDLERVAAPKGTVRLEGKVKARSVQGEVVEIVASRFVAAAVQGSKQIVVGATRIDADVLVAPRIDIDAKAAGRVPIIECHNEPGPNAIKGGFSIAEYDELIGNVESYLAERGVEPLEPGEDDDQEEDDEEPSDVVIEAHAADEASLEALDEDDDIEEAEEAPDEATEDPDTYTDAVALQVGVATAAPDEPVVIEPGVEPEPVQVEEDEELPSLPEDASEPEGGIRTESLPLPPGAKSAPLEEEPEGDGPQDAERIAQVDETFQDIDADESDTTHGQLLEILAELRSCYEDSEQPPVLSELSELVDSREYDEIVSRLPQIWNDLVKYHREQGLRIRRQVTTTFNNIMTIVKNAPSVNLGQG
jgi:hypothetical protein